MRLTRDFSGRSRQAFGPGVGPGAGKTRRQPAYARAVMERRERGERIEFLLVAVDDWQGGREYADGENENAGVARIVLPADCDPAALDFTVATALDVLLCGECAPARFDAAVLALLAANAASVWGQFNEGVWRLAPWRHRAPWYWGVAGPVAPGAFEDTLRRHRTASLLLAEGCYAQTMFQPAREALLGSFGLHPDYSLMSPWPTLAMQREAARLAAMELTSTRPYDDKEELALHLAREHEARQHWASLGGPPA